MLRENGYLFVCRAASPGENRTLKSDCCGQTAQQAVYSGPLTVWWKDAADEAYKKEMLRYTELAAEMKQQGLKVWRLNSNSLLQSQAE